MHTLLKIRSVSCTPDVWWIDVTFLLVIVCWIMNYVMIFIFVVVYVMMFSCKNLLDWISIILFLWNEFYRNLLNLSKFFMIHLVLYARFCRLLLIWMYILENSCSNFCCCLIFAENSRVMIASYSVIKLNWSDSQENLLIW
jgi:hypothetical protein